MFVLILGANKREALVLFINAVYDLENYGMTYVRAIVNSEHVIVGIGSKYIRIFTPTWRCKNRQDMSNINVPQNIYSEIGKGGTTIKVMHVWV